MTRALNRMPGWLIAILLLASVGIAGFYSYSKDYLFPSGPGGQAQIAREHAELIGTNAQVACQMFAGDHAKGWPDNLNSDSIKAYIISEDDIKGFVYEKPPFPTTDSTPEDTEIGYVDTKWGRVIQYANGTQAWKVKAADAQKSPPSG